LKTYRDTLERLVCWLRYYIIIGILVAAYNNNNNNNNNNVKQEYSTYKSPMKTDTKIKQYLESQQIWIMIIG